ncbi:hypothetical protein Tco_0978060 [Tanacetum coccineum]|uniref:Retrotransposon gag domain-containing protein n=1 Tax=Tanacetum coccineum TaxID=301880 RepID=A0ABQ5ELV3_9ASTR
MNLMEYGMAAHLMTILEKSSLHEEVFMKDHHESGCFGDSLTTLKEKWRMSLSTIAGTRRNKTTHVEDLRAHKPWMEQEYPNHSSLCGTYGVEEGGFGTSSELSVPGSHKDQVSILAKDKGFGYEMHKSEESKAVYGVTPPKDYAVTYSNEEMSHQTLYGVKPLLLYATTFKFTRDDLSESALRRNIGDKLGFNHYKLGCPARVNVGECGIVDISIFIMAEGEIDNITMKQYLALNRENQAPGVVKPEIGGNVNFEIKSQFMQKLREDTFSGNKNDDAHEHVERVLDIVSLFNIPGVSHDAVMLHVFPITITRAAKRWVDRLPPGTVNFWDLLKKSLYPKVPTTIKDCRKQLMEFATSSRKAKLRGAYEQTPGGINVKKDRDGRMEIGKKGHMLDDIWENFRKVQGDNTYWWHDQKSKEEERQKLGINIEEYDPPMVHVETFEVKRQSFDTGQSFIRVTKELLDALPIGRENGSRFRDMIRKEVDSGRRIHR